MLTPALVRCGALLLLSLTLFSRLFAADAPVWWTSGSSPAVVDDPANPTDHWAMANLGQLKNMATQAKAHIEAQLSLTPAEWATAWNDAYSPYPNPLPFAAGANPENLEPINIGQLKFVASGFYKLIHEKFPSYNVPARLQAVGVPLGSISGTGPFFPWSTVTPGDPDNHAAVTIGQLKVVFSFDLSNSINNPDTDNDGLLDAWEIQYFGDLDESAGGNPDGDGMTNLQEFQGGTDPTDYFNGGTPVITVLAGGEGLPGTSGLLQVRVTNTVGHWLAHAPVTFSISAGTSQLAASTSASAALAGTLSLRTLADGTASVYYRTTVGDSPAGSVAVTAGLASATLLFNGGTTGNLPPTVALSTPTSGQTLDGALGITLMAIAADVDGSVAKIEIFAGQLRLWESTSSPYQIVWATPPGGEHVLYARATDNAGAVTISAEVNITVIGATPPTATYDYEATGGIAVGQLAGQSAWLASGDRVQVTNTSAQAGTQSVVILPPVSGSTVHGAWVVLGTTVPGQKARYLDFWIKPATDTESSFFSASPDQHVLFLRSGNTAELMSYYSLDGDEEILFSGRSIPVDANGRASNWHRITIREDLHYGGMDVYLDGQFALGNLRFSSGQNRFQLFGHPREATSLDNFRILAENPLFPDADHDGMDDAWESAHGLDPTTNDRDGDPDRDGLTTIEEYVLGTHPSLADSDGDGLRDDWEIDHGFNALVAESAAVLSADTDNDGLDLKEESAAGTDPQDADSDSDGINDGVEMAAGWDPFQYAGDVDGDGVSNQNEVTNGTDPVDYYNGVPPVITTPTMPPDGSLLDGSRIEVRVTNTAGAPFLNAPVTLTASSPDHGFSPTLEDKYANARKSLRVRTDESGMARFYVVRADELVEALP